jgi:hypothetical protein
VTELDAVNVLLSIIGEAPIESFATVDTNEVSDSALARRTLTEVARDVMSEGWQWNTDRGVAIAPTADGTFLLPSDTLKAVFSRQMDNDGRYVLRGLRVWDRVLQTYELDIERLVIDDLVRVLKWDDLPHTAQQYVVIRAGRIYSSRYINSSTIFSYTVQDEEYARGMLMRDEEQREQNNMLWNDGPHGIGYRPALGLRHRIV